MNQVKEIINSLLLIKKNKINNISSKHVEGNEINFTYIYSSISNSHISKVNVFSDNHWDFKDDNPYQHVIAPNHLKINFGKFSNIPMPVICELKCITVVWRAIRDINGHRCVDITICQHISNVLTFLDKIFDYLNITHGKEYVQAKYSSIAQINKSDFKDAIKKNKIVSNKSINIFFNSVINSLPIMEYVLIEIPFTFNPNDFEWSKPKRKERISVKILSNELFEESVFNASIIIVDFLKRLNLPVNDYDTEYRMKYRSLSSSIYTYSNVDKHTLEAYRFSKLYKSGYSVDFINQYGIPLEFYTSYHSHNKLMSRLSISAVLRKQKGRIDASPDECIEYLKLVYESIITIFLEFTGMRASELAKVVLNNWQSVTGVEKGIIYDPIPRICSRVGKHRDVRDSLFSDKWVLIPILVDALSAAEWISTVTQNKYLSAPTHITLKPDQKSTPGVNSSVLNHLKSFFLKFSDSYPTQQTLRDTLAYQLFRIDLGLPYISYQLKHLVDTIDKETSLGTVSNVTLGYGDIANKLAKDGKIIRKMAEVDNIKSSYDPDGSYTGGKGKEHKSRLKRAFKGYLEAGYTKDEVFNAMAEQGMGIVNIGGALCYGNREDEYDSSLPCVGSLRCNPVRCKQAVIGKANLPRWKEIYYSNKSALESGKVVGNEKAIQEAMNEARMVIEYIEGNGVDL